MGLAHLILDLDELKPKRRYADLGSYYGTPQQAYQQGQQAGQQSGYESGQSAMQRSGQAPTQTELGATGATINDPSVNPNAYQYGGTPGGAAAFNNQLGQANAAVQNESAAQIQNANDARDQGNVQGTLGGLSSFYQGQLNGTGPSLAQQQMNAATNQNIAAQQAAANSTHGSLAAAGAGMQAGQTAAGMEQNAAQQAMQGRIQEEYNAAQGMQGLGGLYENEQGLNIGQAEQQAQLQEEQQKLQAGTGLGYAGLENQVNTEQLGAQQNQQAQMSNNYLGASGMGMNQSQFNTTQGWNEAMGGVGAGLGLLAAFADADFQEPSRIGRPMTPAKMTLGPRGYADGDMQPPAHLTMREERPVDGHPFLALADQNNHTVERIKTEPLDAKERARVNAPHGAGPLFADSGRMHTTMHDAGLSDPNIQAGLSNLDWGASNAPANAGGGGTLLDQVRAQEAARVAAAAPAGGYTFAQQRFYPGAATPQAQAQMPGAESAPPLSPETQAALRPQGAMSPSGLAASNYAHGWDNVKPAATAAAAKDDGKKRQTLDNLAMMMMGNSMSRPTPYAYQDLDLDEEHKLAALYGRR